jgi:hypothetical protein
MKPTKIITSLLVAAALAGLVGLGFWAVSPLTAPDAPVELPPQRAKEFQQRIDSLKNEAACFQAQAADYAAKSDSLKSSRINITQKQKNREIYFEKAMDSLPNATLLQHIQAIERSLAR